MQLSEGLGDVPGWQLKLDSPITGQPGALCHCNGHHSLCIKSIGASACRSLVCRSDWTVWDQIVPFTPTWIRLIGSNWSDWLWRSYDPATPGGLPVFFFKARVVSKANQASWCTFLRFFSKWNSKDSPLLKWAGRECMGTQIISISDLAWWLRCRHEGMKWF